jgi:hypothetical protein
MVVVCGARFKARWEDVADKERGMPSASSEESNAMRTPHGRLGTVCRGDAATARRRIKRTDG